MKKIPCLFARDSAGNLASAYNSAALWVLDGEGVATRKWDGTAVRITNSQWDVTSDANVLLAHQTVWARYDCRRGRVPPPTFHAAQDPDPVTGHWPGWVVADRPCDKWIRVAVGSELWQPGTYEACGPNINGNPEKLERHVLIPHGAWELRNVPTDFEGLRTYLDHAGIEGVVWWRNPDDVDCDKVKITAAALDVPRWPVDLRKYTGRITDNAAQFVFDGD